MSKIHFENYHIRILKPRNYQIHNSVDFATS